MPNDKWIQQRLGTIAEAGRLRRLRTLPGSGGIIDAGDRRILNFSSNDYLDLARHPEVVARARRYATAYGAGSTASRLVCGSLPCHEELESRLAAFKQYPAALLFGSGFMTNAGVIPALVGREDTVYADKLAHASILDAVTLSRAKLRRFRHNDAGHLNDLLNRHSTGRALVVVESVYSMDGDLAPLPSMREIADRHGAMLMVDEAHATGIFGPGGRGCANMLPGACPVAVSMGTLSKALGGYGGFIACSAALRNLLINTSRAFIYTTAPPPATVGAALGALDVIENDPDRGVQLRKHAERFRNLLRQAGLDTMNAESQIIPVLVGDNERAMQITRRLEERNIIAVAIRPPTVPEGTARIRLSVTLAHTEEDLADAATCIIDTARTNGII